MEYFIGYLESIHGSVYEIIPELLLVTGIILVLVSGLIKNTNMIPAVLSVVIFAASISVVCSDFTGSYVLFGSMMRSDSFSGFFKILFDISGILTVLMSWKDRTKPSRSEYYIMIVAIVLGAHLLVMSTNLLIAFISLEIISICSYVLAGFTFSKKSAEGSLKYFLFGAVASAIMLYGFSILYGLTGTLDISPLSTRSEFITNLAAQHSPLVVVAGVMALAGFLFKAVAVPMHPWAPDVYEAAPMPVVAFFSVVPKLAGIGALIRFTAALSVTKASGYDWQPILCVVAFLTLTAGNFSALWQKNPKRMMAYSSIAQSGLMLVAIASFGPLDYKFILFYATVYMLMNYLVFIYLQYFESFGIDSMEAFGGAGKYFLWPSVFCLVGLIALTGLPPTAGFTGKLLIFSSLWQSYELTGKLFLAALLIFGLLNTVVSLFFYLKIPYYSFLKTGERFEKQNILTFENLLGLILVLLLLVLFFQPGLLMGWINKITFVL